MASQTAKQSVLNVTASPGGNVKATLRASATGLLLSPSGVGFADTAPGQVSLPRVVTITNTAAVTSSAIAVTAGGGNPSAFPITDDTCAGASLAPGAQCGFTVRFAPTAEGFMSALVSFSATTGGYPILSLAGTGLGARIDILPTGTEYGKVGPGTTKDKSMNVVNSGLVTSGPLSIALGGPDMAQFSVVADACTGVSLAPNQSCGLTIRFSPASSGVKTAHVTASATPGGSFNAWLKGEGAFA